MRCPAIGSLSLFVVLLSAASAACSAGQDGFVTVGIRPTGGAAASRDITASDAGGLPVPGSRVPNDVLDGNGTRTEDGGATGASDASAGMTGSAGSGGAAIAGAGGAESGAAGAGGSVAPNEDECGAIPSQPAGNATSGRVGGSGLIGYGVSAPNAFVRLRTTLVVPAEPAPNGHIFVWPGLQPTPTATNLQPIGNGALLSVMTWGPFCVPDAPPSYSTWGIAPMYSNLSTSDPQYSGCHGGKVVRAEPEQLLDIDIRLDGMTWVQNVVNRDTMETSDFIMDLQGQSQGRAFFDIELQTSNKPTEDIVFIHTILSMDRPDPDACQPLLRGTNDFASRPRVSPDGKHCCIDRIVLRAAGVMATTTDPP